MECEECKIEMRMNKVEDNSMYFSCPKCGKTKVMTVQEVEDTFTE